MIGMIQYIELMHQAKVEIAELEAELEAERIRHTKTSNLTAEELGWVLSVCRAARKKDVMRLDKGAARFDRLDPKSSIAQRIRVGSSAHEKLKAQASMARQQVSSTCTEGRNINQQGIIST